MKLGGKGLVRGTGCDEGVGLREDVREVSCGGGLSAAVTRGLCC